MITKIIKSQKPISLDVHLKYRCPNGNCGYEHWLSLLETQTKNFKVVCDCGIVFKPKQINKLKIIYDNKEIKIKNNNDDTSNKPTVVTIQPSETSLSKAVPYLINFGFTDEEAVEALTKSYIKQPTDNISIWIKNTLLEINNHG